MEEALDLQEKLEASRNQLQAREVEINKLESKLAETTKRHDDIRKVRLVVIMRLSSQFDMVDTLEPVRRDPKNQRCCRSSTPRLHENHPGCEITTQCTATESRSTT